MTLTAAGLVALVAVARCRWRERPAAVRRALVRGLPDALDDVARSLRSGASLVQALDEVGRTGSGPATTSLARLAEATARGVPLAAACGRWSEVVPLPEVRVAATALSLAASAGGAQARALDSAATSLRERAAVAGTVRAATAQARLSAVVLTLLAPAFTTWTVATDPGVRTFLLGGAAGWGCLAAGAVLDLAGALWIARIVGSVR